MKSSGIFVAFLLMCQMAVNAQEAIPASGGDGAGTGGSFSYTVGQVAYTAISSSSFSISEGVQQPYEISTGIEDDFAEFNLVLTIYPNPTSESLALQVDNYNHENLSYQLFDMQGKRIDSKQVLASTTIIGMKDLSASTYLLSVLYNTITVKTFRIVKN